MKKYTILRKKYTIFLGAFLGGCCLFFLISNCTSSDSSNRGGDTNNSDEYGFTPGGNSNSYDPDSYGNPNSPNTGYRDKTTSSSFSSAANDDDRDGQSYDESNDDCFEGTYDEDNPLGKSNSVLDNEKRFGASAPITITSRAAFEDFRLGEPVNDYDDIEQLRVYTKLSKTSQGYYAGDVTISWYEYNSTGRVKVSNTFKSGSGSKARYNIWFTEDPNESAGYHGFFQENNGSLILVIDRAYSQVLDICDPDETDPTLEFFEGSIWSMQFRTTFNDRNSCNNQDNVYIRDHNRNNSSSYGKSPIPLLSERNKQCWEIRSGPYDCRTWRSGSGVNTYRAFEPDGNCYRKIGRFKYLDPYKSLDIEDLDDIVVKTP